MAGLLSRLAPKGYPGQIFVIKLRYGYGTQQHIEKLELLHSWYSNLIAYLPEMYSKNDQKKDEYQKEYAPLFEKVAQKLADAREMYSGTFEGVSCNPEEKKLIGHMWGIKEDLDVITAKSKIIDDMKSDGEEFNV